MTTPDQLDCSAITFENVLFSRSIEHERKELAAIYNLHHAAMGGTDQHWCFSYRGIDYGHERYVNGRLPRPVPRLAPALRERMAKYVAEKEKLDIYERPCIRTYLKSCFRTTLNEDDLKQLIPDSLHTLIPDVLRSYWGDINAAPLPPAQLREFLAKNQRYLDMIRQRLALNMLEDALSQ